MKTQATGNDNSSLFNLLPDEIVLEILNKIIDLKTLCCCYVVCKRFSSIVVQIDNISFTTPPIDFDDGVPSSNAVEACFESDSFRSAIKSMNKFRGLKSLSINLSFPTLEKDNRYKWKVKFGNNRVDSFLLLSPNSVYRFNTNNGLGEVLETKTKIRHILFKCLMDAKSRFSMLKDFIMGFLLLEKVSITDSAKMGTVFVNSGGQIAEMRNCLLSHSGRLKHCKKNFFRVSVCDIPLLELPVSRYVMKDVYMILLEKNDVPDGNNSFNNFDGNEDNFEDKHHQAAAYTEAVNEIFNKHKGSIRRLPR